MFEIFDFVVVDALGNLEGPTFDNVDGVSLFALFEHILVPT